MAPSWKPSPRKNSVDKSNYLSDAIINFLEDQEDIAIATERLKNPGKPMSLDEIGRKYGLVE